MLVSILIYVFIFFLPCQVSLACIYKSTFPKHQYSQALNKFSVTALARGSFIGVVAIGPATPRPCRPLPWELAGLSALLPYPYWRKTSGKPLYTEIYHSTAGCAGSGTASLNTEIHWCADCRAHFASIIYCNDKSVANCPGVKPRMVQVLNYVNKGRLKTNIGSYVVRRGNFILRSLCIPFYVGLCKTEGTTAKTSYSLIKSYWINWRMPMSRLTNVKDKHSSKIQDSMHKDNTWQDRGILPAYPQPAGFTSAAVREQPSAWL